MSGRARIESHLDRLFAYAFSLVHDRDQARDLVQDCALRALRSARVPRDPAAYRAWLFRILRNSFIDSLRRKGEVPLDDDSGDGGPAEAVDWNCDARLVDVLTVRLGLRKLSPPHREIIALVDLAGLSYQEAGDVLEIAPGTVMSRLSRARQALLKVIADENVMPHPAAGRNLRG